MFLLSRLFGTQRKIRKLRKKWDRLREKALKKKGRFRTDLLLKLDQVEQSIRLLEERKMNKWEIAKIAKEVEIELAEIEAMVKLKEDEVYFSQKERDFQAY
ncbi:MAG TPA: hypothetical protein ENG42_03140 [Candidatus Aenigmarchaeota archaeon]|nr:MAG: hypothetical protein DRP03_03330 [Candidatus Aenigmarchaeota archaeon]HDD46446.1 hypothetical protein [Candidatus Aenigmarchaeota archaeon]